MKLPDYLSWMNTYDVLAGGKVYNYHLIDELPWTLCLNKMLLEHERYLVEKNNNKL